MDPQLVGNNNICKSSLDGQFVVEPIQNRHHSSTAVRPDSRRDGNDDLDIGAGLIPWIPLERVIRHVTPVVLDALRGIAHGVSTVFVICDYGTSDGLSSMSLMKSVIGALKGKYGVDQQILIVYEDLPENDFTSLFKVLGGKQRGPVSYMQDNPNVFVTSCGRSFYTQCLPNEHVNLGFCSTALHRLSQSPCSLPDTVACSESDCAESIGSFADQAAEDYNRFLLCRAKELAPGGRFVLVVPCLMSDGQYTGYTRGVRFSWYGTMSRLWKKMMDVGKITAKEFINTNMNSYFRTVAELEKPFLCRSSPVFTAGLRLVHVTEEVLQCSFHEAMCQAVKTGEDNAVRASVTPFIQFAYHWMAPSFYEGLSSERPSAVKDQLVNEMFSSFEDAVTADPTNYGIHHCIACVHIAKENTG